MPAISSQETGTVSSLYFSERHLKCVLAVAVQTAGTLFPHAEMLAIKEKGAAWAETPVKPRSGSFLPRLSSWPRCLRQGQAHSHHALRWLGFFALFQEDTLTKLRLLRLEGAWVLVARWPTSSSTPLQTKIDLIIHPGQFSKNVNKEQKLPVLHISRGLHGTGAFLKLILLQAWPRPFLSTPLSKAAARGCAPSCLYSPYLALADTGSPHSLGFCLSLSSCGLALPLSSAWPSPSPVHILLIDCNLSFSGPPAGMCTFLWIFQV